MHAAPMANANHQDEEFVVPDFEHDPVRANSNPPQTGVLALEGRAHVRLQSQSFDVLDERTPGCHVDTCELLGGASLDRAE